MKITEISYSAPTRQVLAIPDHYVAFGMIHAKAGVGTEGLSVLVDTRYIVKAGTIWPANDSTAQGFVLNDYDVTDGDQMMSIVIHGFVKTSELPAVPVSAAIAALNQITFVPFIDMDITFTGTLASIAVGATADPAAVVFTLDNAQFRDGAETLSNWTIAGEATTKVTVASIVIAADGVTATITMTQDAAAVAGSVTVIPSTSIINTGKTVSAVTIATVA